MRMFFYHIIIVALCSVCPVHSLTIGDHELGGRIEKKINQEPLFVSLGSVCITAHMLRACGIRKAAFPFDWIVSFDIDKLVEILDKDFVQFLNPTFLRIEGASLLNDYYHLEFPNEGDWEAAGYKIDEFTKKCQRRIDRFRQLANYGGKVIFVRTAYPHSTSDSRVWKNPDNINISYQNATKLYNTLKNRFPVLDFTLIIMNTNDREGFELDKESSEHLLMVRIGKTTDSYREFYSQLLSKLKT